MTLSSTTVSTSCGWRWRAAAGVGQGRRRPDLSADQGPARVVSRLQRGRLGVHQRLPGRPDASDRPDLHRPARPPRPCRRALRPAVTAGVRLFRVWPRLLATFRPGRW